MTARPVARADSEDQSPLSKQRMISRGHRVPRIVDPGCLRRGAVELDDLEISPTLEVIVVLATNVVLKTEAIEDREALGIARLSIVRVPKTFTKVLPPVVWKRG